MRHSFAEAMSKKGTLLSGRWGECAPGREAMTAMQAAVIRVKRLFWIVSSFATFKVQVITIIQRRLLTVQA